MTTGRTIRTAGRKGKIPHTFTGLLCASQCTFLQNFYEFHIWGDVMICRRGVVHLPFYEANGRKLKKEKEEEKKINNRQKERQEGEIEEELVMGK